MKNNPLHLLFLGFISLLLPFQAISAPSKTLPVENLLKRIAPQYADSIRFEPISSKGGKDVYELESVGKKIVVRGNNANAMARGLGVYLRRFCQVSVSWDADAAITIPDQHPLVPKKIQGVCDAKNRFFFNYCTFGYTMPFWQWNDWERCIDWMALNGINMPLAMTGAEKILMEVWQEQGFSKKEILGFFTDAAHMPWYHMNTISRWGGPCPESYVEYGYKLQKKILARERELGMHPILPAFNGRVPVELKKRFPKKKITVLGQGWGMFKEPYYTYFLDPYDPLFAKLQKSFIEHAKKLYGTDHLYGVDPFNEITPPSWEPEYLSKTARRIYETMANADKDAIWIQMGWLFYFDKHWTSERVKALLTAVPKGKLVMLDYYCESKELWKTTEAFFDVPFIWCYLGNFGGKECLAGPLPNMKKQFAGVLKERGGKNLWGIGSTLEGFGVNMMTYEFLFDMPWSDTPKTQEEWMEEYAASRAGTKDPAVVEAWKLLLEKVYNPNSSSYSGGSPLHVRPRFEGSCGFVIMGRNFTPAPLMDAWTLMMKASESTIAKDSFRYDLVNIIRQYLGDLSGNIRSTMRSAHITGNKEKFDRASKIFTELLQDQEEIVRSRPEFLMGRWIDDARSIGTTDREKEALEWSVRNILTTWGPARCPLVEYANRDWDGLTRDYYLARWNLFIQKAGEALREGVPFNQDEFDNQAVEFEWDFIAKNRTHYTDGPEGDSWKIAQRLFAKYSTMKLEKTQNTATKTKLTSWTPSDLSTQYQKVSWDISKYIDKKGICVVSFNYNGGAHALQMRKVQLKRGGVVVAEDLHEGWTGNENRGNTFKFSINELVPAATYTLEAEWRCSIEDTQEIDSRGEVEMEFFTQN